MAQIPQPPPVPQPPRHPPPKPPVPASIDQGTVDRIAQAVLALIKPELAKMSGTLEQQMEADTTTITNAVSAAAADVVNLGSIATTISAEIASLGSLQAGNTLSAQDVTNLGNAAAAATALQQSTDALVTTMQNIANAGTVANTGTVTNAGT